MHLLHKFNVTEYVQRFYPEIRNTGHSILPIAAFPADKNKETRKLIEEISLKNNKLAHNDT